MTELSDDAILGRLVELNAELLEVTLFFFANHAMSESAPMLTIGKPAVFGRDGMAMHGQYAIDSAGWNLRWFVKGRETLLYTGPLSTCRRFQAACRDLTDVDAMRRVIDAHLVGETVEMLPLSPMPTEIYPPVTDEDGVMRPPSPAFLAGADAAADAPPPPAADSAPGKSPSQKRRPPSRARRRR